MSLKKLQAAVLLRVPLAEDRELLRRAYALVLSAPDPVPGSLDVHVLEKQKPHRGMRSLFYDFNRYEGPSADCFVRSSGLQVGLQVRFSRAIQWRNVSEGTSMDMPFKVRIDVSPRRSNSLR